MCRSTIWNRAPTTTPTRTALLTPPSRINSSLFTPERGRLACSKLLLNHTHTPTRHRTRNGSAHTCRSIPLNRSNCPLKAALGRVVARVVRATLLWLGLEHSLHDVALVLPHLGEVLMAALRAAAQSQALPMGHGIVSGARIQGWTDGRVPRDGRTVATCLAPLS